MITSDFCLVFMTLFINMIMRVQPSLLYYILWFSLLFFMLFRQKTTVSPPSQFHSKKNTWIPSWKHIRISNPWLQRLMAAWLTNVHRYGNHYNIRLLIDVNRFSLHILGSGVMNNVSAALCRFVACPKSQCRGRNQLSVWGIFLCM